MTDISDDNHVARLREMAAHAPRESGVYFWKDSDDTIIYVGKAVRLKERLLSYFNDKSIKTEELLAHSVKIEYMTVSNEYEALILENNLIKRHQPRYNIQLKDHKTYPVIRITGEAYPRVFRTRTIVKTGGEYFGPFPGAKRVNLYIELVDKLFPLRKCKSIPLRKRKEPCLYYHMGRCLGPCSGKTTPELYASEVSRVRAMLEGKISDITKDFTVKMNDASAAMDYERAASWRDALQTIQMVIETQNVEDRMEEKRDYLGFAGSGGLYRFVILAMRGGKLVGKSSIRVESPADAEEVTTEFVVRYYEDSGPERTPDVVYLENPGGEDLINRFFKEETLSGLRVRSPIDERDNRLLRMAFENAVLDFSSETDREKTMQDLKEALGMRTLPRRIEGFDIAQLSGHFTVASLISFKNGAPEKDGYRRFRMKSLKDGEIDDFKSISEAVARRFTRRVNEKLELPDLLIVDGGKGQVSAAYSVLEALGIENRVFLVGLAKREEELFIHGRKDPIILPVDSPASRLCQAVRNETHRVATTYNKKLRASTLTLSRLEKTAGVGPKRSKALLIHFGSIDAIAGATVSEIMRISGLSIAAAQTLKTNLGGSPLPTVNE